MRTAKLDSTTGCFVYRSLPLYATEHQRGTKALTTTSCPTRPWNRQNVFWIVPVLSTARQGQNAAANAIDYGQHCSLNRWIQTTFSNSKNAVSISSAR